MLRTKEQGNLIIFKQWQNGIRHVARTVFNPSFSAFSCCGAHNMGKWCQGIFKSSVSFQLLYEMRSFMGGHFQHLFLVRILSADNDETRNAHVQSATCRRPDIFRILGLHEDNGNVVQHLF